MEDLSDYLKRFQSLHKKKGDNFGSILDPGTVTERAANLKEHRKQTRNDLIFKRRHIPENMSPVVSIQEPKPVTARNNGGNKRLEMLAKWKAERQKQKLRAKNTEKPIFKVCHVPVNIGLPDLKTVNCEIKGKAFKSKFAPENHRFRAPANIKPLYFDNKVSSRVKTQPVERSPVVTRSQTLRSSRAKENQAANTESKTPKKSGRPVKPDANKKKQNSTTRSVEQNKTQLAKSATKVNTPAPSATKRTRSVQREKAQSVQKTNKVIDSVQSTSRSELNQSKSASVKQPVRKGKRSKASSARKSPPKEPSEERQPVDENAPDDVSETSTEPALAEINSETNGDVAADVPIESSDLNADMNAEETDANTSNSRESSSVSCGSVKSQSSMSPDFPVNYSRNVSLNRTMTPVRRDLQSLKTPVKTDLPAVYISPFVTVSRGKNSARKEYVNRKSRGGFSPEGDLAQYTSPVAGAVYFANMLDKEISRLEGLCEQWTKYKEGEDLPEEAVSLIDVAIGQSNLLMTKKFMQFRGLIEECRHQSSEKAVTCEDLHGFWDMIYLQVNNLEKRFSNLDSLKDNNWQEVLDKPKQAPAKKRARAAKKATATSALREAIKAARKKKQTSEDGDEVQISEVNSEIKQRKSSLSARTPKRKSLLTVVQAKDSAKRNSSPGLMMMKVTQIVKDIETPAKGILKTDLSKSSKKKSKGVLFQDDVDKSVKMAEIAEDVENDLNKSNSFTADSSSKVKTPGRKSLRLSRAKLF